MKTLKISTHDKPYITKELKDLDRKKRREYCKNGRSEKYLEIRKEYDNKMRKATAKYLKKNVSLLKHENPRRAYKILKNMGAPPAENHENGAFSLSNHVEENLTAQQSVDRIAHHFAKIKNIHR